jgi:hypothetical protein
MNVPLSAQTEKQVIPGVMQQPELIVGRSVVLREIVFCEPEADRQGSEYIHFDLVAQLGG